MDVGGTAAASDLWVTSDGDGDDCRRRGLVQPGDEGRS